jgi:hypothetical protein
MAQDPGRVIDDPVLTVIEEDALTDGSLIRMAPDDDGSFLDGVIRAGTPHAVSNSLSDGRTGDLRGRDVCFERPRGC